MKIGKKFKGVVFALSALTLTGLVAGTVTSCGEGEATVSKITSFTVALKSGKTSLTAGATDSVVISKVTPTGVTGTYTYESSDTAVLTVASTGAVTAVAEGSATITVTEAEGAKNTLALTVTPDYGGKVGKSYVGSSYEERTDITGVLENYAVDHHLTGLSLYENGGYVMYNPRIQKGTETYISGYGFGILGEGNITSDLTEKQESVAGYRSYYHTYDASDPQTINYLDDSGSQVSNLYEYQASSYWGTRMNAKKDGYDWYPVLAKEKPVAVDAADNGLATTWKFKVKTGVDGLVYNTSSTKYSKYAGRAVELEDYVYAYKVLMTQKNGLYRGAEMCGDNGAGTIKGNTQYWNASADGENDEAFESMVGVKADSTDNSLTITLNAPVNQFYAMYYLASSLTEPICKDFLDEVGIDNYGKNDTTKGTTPVDNILALGAYMLEEWEADKKIVFKKNDKWIEATHPEYEDTANLHNIKGVHIAILTGAATDKELAFKEFLDGKLDACSIPSTQLASYVDDPRTTTTKGDSVFKLNMNSCDQSTWNELFGVNGSITQTAESDYWQCKPLMSNDNFLNGLDCAINREEFATSVGSIPSQNYFSTNYMSDPENGISYDTTEQHAAVLADRFPETYGYNYDAAQQLFSKAIDEEIAAGTITAGTATSPTVQYIDVWWMYEYMTTEYASIGQYIEKAFNSVGIDKGVKLVVRNSAVSVWSDVYYKHLMVGQFDLGFGSISGNSLNPINFMEVLRSDNSSGFTLNWGTDTSVVSDEINYDGMNWSYNALWQAADTGVIVDSDGNQVVAHKFGTPEVKSFNDDGSVTVTVALELAVAAGATIKLETAYFYYASIAANDYVSVDVEWSYVDNVLTYIIPKSVIDDDMKYYCEFDIIYSITIDGVTTEINKWVEPDDYGFLHQ